MKKTAYLTPDIWEIETDTEDLLAYSVKGEDLTVDTTPDTPTGDIEDDNRSRGFDLWSE